MVIGRKRCRLNDEDVFTPDIFLNFYENFLISKAPDGGPAQGNIEIIADRLGKLPVRIPCENLHLGPPISDLIAALLPSLHSNARG
jgi:hypothetical protein